MMAGIGLVAMSFPPDEPLNLIDSAVTQKKHRMLGV
jgi:hypothetical protein